MRLQLAINVENLEESIAFYSKMFDAEPAKIRDGYANFAIAEPPLKLVLFEGPEGPGTINHLGVEVEESSQVIAAESRLQDAGLSPTQVGDTACCYATKTETWVHAPDGIRWEWYVRTGDAETLANVDIPEGADTKELVLESSRTSSCCGPASN